ncbi:MAG: hypothetical protein ACLQBY_16540 [Solirubrobacteraceae bacterium]
MSHPDRRARATRSAAPSDELVLAAVERAGRHQARDTPAVPVWAILEHLAVPRRSGAARHVRERLGALHAAGWLERSRRHSVPTWALSDAGLAHLRRARRDGALPALPESPQHRAWRDARTAAAQEIERFRASVRERVARAALLLDAEEPPHSDAWLELAEELQRACRRLGSASHCLYEWVEPDDAHADVDEHVEPADEQLDPSERAVRRARRAGRRNIRLWDERRGC